MARFDGVTVWAGKFTTPDAWYSELFDRIFVDVYETRAFGLDVTRQLVVGPTRSRFLRLVTDPRV